MIINKYRILTWIVAVGIGYGVAFFVFHTGSWTLAISIPFIIFYTMITSYLMMLNDRKEKN